MGDNIDLLKQELDAERKRSEKLDSLLVTNANLRKKLQDELAESKQLAAALASQLDVAQGTAAAELAKAIAEAASYKQFYAKAIEEVAQYRHAAQQAQLRAVAAEEERDAFQQHNEEKESQLAQFSPKRPAKGGKSVHVEEIADLEDEDFSRQAAAESDLQTTPDNFRRLAAEEVQSVVVGLYRRLRACELALHETSQSRLDALAKHIDLQREVEHLQRRLAIRSPLVVRREMAQQRSASGAATESRSSSVTRRPVGVAAQSSNSRPTSATRPASRVASRSPVASQGKQANGTSSATASARSIAVSHSSATSEKKKGDLLRLNQIQLREEYLGLLHRSRSPNIILGSAGTVLKSAKQVPPAALAGGAVAHHGQPPVTGSSLVPPPPQLRPPSATRRADNSASNAGAPRASGNSAVSGSGAVHVALSDAPPVISRRANINSEQR